MASASPSSLQRQRCTRFANRPAPSPAPFFADYKTTSADQVERQKDRTPWGTVRTVPETAGVPLKSAAVGARKDLRWCNVRKVFAPLVVEFERLQQPATVSSAECHYFLAQPPRDRMNSHLRDFPLGVASNKSK
eukprot:NODE_6259_length_589_cov_43.368519_g5849_i0.p1 GENE.NODE_6259_length_589_cov_43.368519_g5849_i0~~NODE_6259_length_589_cov_43.368519_g5849_i0.p1  ORF type:complete len:152 (+),score=24.11 NODE_6259_length_589_cov_43.368519_g5849_i0:57-458(+)